MRDMSWKSRRSPADAERPLLLVCSSGGHLLQLVGLADAFAVPNLLRNLRLAATLLRRERPRAIVSTGAGVAVPFAWIGRLRGIPVVYIESVTRITSLSLSGRMIKPIANDLFVQWPELAETVPGARYEGSNLATAA
jgi:UDP-N-acetylglucosamine:LPS N-acetylglucosamine transferase